jgi:hypothetical protein
LGLTFPFCGPCALTHEFCGLHCPRPFVLSQERLEGAGPPVLWIVLDGAGPDPAMAAKLLVRQTYHRSCLEKNLKRLVAAT